ncbi:Leo1-like protein-domain-containing protein [Podospora didyma]|uniref:Leo1-like protein-domain-containing protein n=1 Tax=Podospora didyma TaxID=330526 RepID=A0AAE0P677_9PEZI|nr:Leo1-like protein-domain-containing protein [Podospora didyma]
MSDSEDPIDVPNEGGDDLFGDDDDGDNPISEIENALSDRELASDNDDEDGDDSGRQKRRDTQEPTEFREKLVAEVPMYRHRTPKSRDGNLHSLKVPEFLKLLPLEYKPDSWTPSKWELENAKLETPVPTVMFKRDSLGRVQSNTNVYKWSDGSTTIAIGDEHYEILTKSLAPPRNKPYQEVQDAHYYAAAAHLTTNSLLIIGHFTEQYTVKPNQDLQDHALERLKAQMLGAEKERKTDMIVVTKEDPELQKRQAEQAEKERAKLQRRRETAAARVEGAAGRYKGGALSINDLESRRSGAPGARGQKRGAAGGGKKKHRRPEYDSDDDLPSGARQNDNYDMDDGFLVASDEESEGVDDDDDEEELLDDDEDERPRKKRQKTADPDDDADGDYGGPAHSKPRRRKVIVDDDEE